jgi:hypothetical protein
MIGAKRRRKTIWSVIIYFPISYKNDRETRPLRKKATIPRSLVYRGFEDVNYICLFRQTFFERRDVET